MNSIEGNIGPTLENVNIYDSGDKQAEEAAVQKSNPIKRLASFVLRRAQSGNPSESLRDSTGSTTKAVVQEIEYTELYPDSIEDIREAEVMAYAAKESMEEAVLHKSKAEIARNNIGVSDYVPESGYMSAEQEAEMNRIKVREAVARANRLADEAQSAYRDHESLPSF